MTSQYANVLAACLIGAAGTFTPRPAHAAPQIGIFEHHADVGAVKTPGTATYDAAAQAYTLQGSGTNIWFAADEFQFAWKKISGDFILQARVEFQGKGVEAHRKVGLMVRSSLDTAAPHVDAARHGDGLTSLQFRRSAGANTEEMRSDAAGSDVLQLERHGGTYRMSVARFGEPYSSTELTGVSLGDDVYVGIYVCAHNPAVTETAVFRNVRLIRPAKDAFTPYRDYIGSDVELLDVETGVRQTVHHVDDSIQAPNWTPDGQRLLMNRNGRMYSFDLAGRTTREIDTGTMTRNNNDHALSFDGKMLGLSGGSPSTVWTVPVGGGTPRQITPVGPSYLHSWSPDGSLLAFTGQRDGEFDIYVVPAAGGPERRLTTSPGLDDGSEFTPDGKWIYFNSTRTGRMQVWRMKPDGSQQEQLTFDDFNNWFPHVSPDGRSIVFVTYGPEVPAGDHPWYKQVYIRRLPIEGGTPKVVAYVYGGQGSMNVNSWAPDNRRIAFVSNSDAFPGAGPAARSVVAPGAGLEKLAGGFEFTEGPTSDAAGNVFFTDQPNDRILKWSVDGKLTTFLQPAGRANGMYFDARGDLLACADEKTELWSIAPDGTRTVLASAFEGKALNGPNDVWVRPDGALYFTDPFYKRPWWKYEARPQAGEHVYFLSADRKTLRRVTSDLDQPNGIIGSPDGRTLFVADIRANKTYAYDIEADGRLSGKRLRCELGSDGMTLDEEGNLYLTGKGVSVCGPSGTVVEHIDVPEAWTANASFGGRDHRTLFITASKGLYAIRLRVKGANAAK
jgi:TolB protein